MKATKSSPASDPVFEFKSAALNMLAFSPLTDDLDKIGHALEIKLGKQQGFFGGDPVIIDLGQVEPPCTAEFITSIKTALERYALKPIAIRHNSENANSIAEAAGLPLLNISSVSDSSTRRTTESAAPAIETSSALIIDRPIRSGQQVYARGGDLIVLALVSHGAELIADGNIHVYATLRGRALAGARGNQDARIFTQCMEAELLSIAGIYRNIDEPLPASIAGKAAQVRLDGSKLSIEAIQI